MKARDWLVTVASSLVIIILAIAMWSAITGRSVTHNRLEERLVTVEQTLQFLTCVIVIHPDERLPASIAACQVDS